jgi:hypothetical protein
LLLLRASAESCPKEVSDETVRQPIEVAISMRPGGLAQALLRVPSGSCGRAWAALAKHIRIPETASAAADVCHAHAPERGIDQNQVRTPNVKRTSFGASPV